MNKICRVCLTSQSDQEFEKIFGNQKIALKIFLISSIKIVELDQTSALICSQCLKDLYQCFLFRKKIQTSDEYFRSKLEASELNLFKFHDETLSEEILIEEEFQIDENCEYEALEEVSIIEDEPKSPPPTRRGRKLQKTKKPYNRLTCKICGITLSRRQRLVQHERLHFLGSTESLYECDMCDKKFNQRFSLIPHFKRYHNFELGSSERWKCAICEDKTVPAGKMEVHYRKFHSEFYSDKKINKLSFKNVKKSPYKKSGRSKKSQPKEKSKNKDWFVCSLCGNSFTCNYRYQKHLNDIHGVTEHEIIQREESTLTNRELKTSKKVPCHACGKSFASLATCKAHEKTHQNLQFTCDLCGKSFKIKAYLTAHVQKIHMKIKRFKCTLCSKQFIHRELLNYHVRKHLNIRNYECQFCQKTFLRKACMLIHERIHVNLRPYTCKYCDRTFIHHSDHRRHEQRHIANETCSGLKLI